MWFDNIDLTLTHHLTRPTEGGVAPDHNRQAVLHYLETQRRNHEPPRLVQACAKLKPPHVLTSSVTWLVGILVSIPGEMNRLR